MLGLEFLNVFFTFSYRLELKTRQASGNDNKEKVAQKKKEVQGKFKRELGFLIDVSKHQSGTTNDGNLLVNFSEIFAPFKMRFLI